MVRLHVLLQHLAAQLRESERGQTMAEYAVVLSVITIAVVGTMVVLAGAINDVLSSVTNTL
jgi:Flp pilus assembly pilin Flp